MKKIFAVLLLPLLAGLAYGAVARPPDAAVLLRSYYRYLVTQQVGGQAQHGVSPPKAAHPTAKCARVPARPPSLAIRPPAATLPAKRG